MVWVAGPDKRSTFFNKAWLDFTGRTMEEEIASGWPDGLHPADAEECMKTYSASFDARKPFAMKYRIQRYDGEYRWITDNGVPRHDARGNFVGYVGASVDITDLLNKEKVLHAFEQRVALAAETARLGVWELETTTNEIWMSDKTLELFQFNGAGQVGYEEFQNRIHPDDRAQRDTAVKRAVDEQSDYEIEYRALLPDGTIRWIAARGRCIADDNGKATRVLGVSMDITERKQAEELFRLAIEASPSGTLLANNQGRIVLINAHIEELFGYPRSELIGKSVEILVPQRFAAQYAGLREAFLAAPETLAVGAGPDLCGLRKDGTEFPVEIGFSPIQTPKGLLVLANVVDISARKAAEAEAEVQRDQIELLSRVSLLGETTALLAHELNQPLSAIVNNANAGSRFIDNGNPDIDVLREIMEDVETDGRRAHDIIDAVRRTIKKGGTIREPINLNDTVGKVIHMVEPEAKVHSCEMETSLAGDLPPVEGDPVQIQQVLINLVTNAFDAMRDTPAARRRVQITTEPNGNGTVCVTVRDRGSGIPADVRGRLFDQFVTTKEEGLGMGLAIVRSIVEAHGGEIAADNPKDGGARFFFTLPTTRNHLS